MNCYYLISVFQPLIQLGHVALLIGLWKNIDTADNCNTLLHNSVSFPPYYWCFLNFPQIPECVRGSNSLLLCTSRSPANLRALILNSRIHWIVPPTNFHLPQFISLKSWWCFLFVKICGGQHGGAVWSLHFSPLFFVGSLRILWVPPTVQSCVSWIHDSKLSLKCANVNVCCWMSALSLNWEPY